MVSDVRRFFLIFYDLPDISSPSHTVAIHTNLQRGRDRGVVAGVDAGPGLVVAGVGEFRRGRAPPGAVALRRQ